MNSKCCLSYYSLSRLALKPFIMIRSLELCIVGFSFKVNAARKSKVDDNTARMQSIKQLGV